MKSVNYLLKYTWIIFLSLLCTKPPILINSENNPVESHKDIVIKVKFSPDGKLLASGGNDSDILMWNGVNGKFLRILHGEYDKIFDIVFMESKNEIITANYQGTLLTWDELKGFKSKEQLGNSFISDIEFNFAGGFFIASIWETSLNVLKIDGHELIHKCKSSDFKIRAIKYSEQTKSIYAGTSSGNLLRWSLDQCSEGENYNQNIHNDAVTSLDVNDELNLLVTSSVDGRVKLFNLSTLKEIGVVKDHKSPVNSVKIIPQFLKVISGAKDGKVIVYDLKTKEKITLTAHIDSINSLDVSPNGELIATGSSDKTVKLWSLKKILNSSK
ncbi:MAG: WD40 repeat domain-containing protein [Spirochaetia bacterium]|nr:WD40 repeat domain-containing protein [Spirochaetia bacterium]